MMRKKEIDNERIILNKLKIGDKIIDTNDLFYNKKLSFDVIGAYLTLLTEDEATFYTLDDLKHKSLATFDVENVITQLMSEGLMIDAKNEKGETVYCYVYHEPKEEYTLNNEGDEYEL